ncbi:MAG: ABC-F family ATP-binding cassette domain-containing protein [Anaerolineales bacterium]|nr:ABC-F family ATP-binding cassette domain-containing protein [Anaerolineales bacterium]
MSLITASNLSKSFGPVDLFSGVSFGLARGSRLALVGPNGIGKTTLLRILLGLEEASGGTVARARNLRPGYLPQEAEFEMGGTVWDACLAPFAGLQKRQEELHSLEEQMADPEKARPVMERYGKLQEAFERDGGYTYSTRIKQVLTGLGFLAEDFHLPLEHLSGGQRTRAYLAHLLLSDPDLLLLDEPTNHLDIAAVEWLEGYLGQWPGAALIVSHDRYFLDSVCTGILEMTLAGLESYPGNYTAYLHERQIRADRRQETFATEKAKLLKDVEYIKKNISGQNVNQAKGRLRRLSRIVQAIEQVGFETVVNQKWSETAEDVNVATSPFGVEEAERRVRALRSPVRTLPRLHLNLRSGGRSGELVIRSRDLQIGYPGRLLFAAPDILLRRRECAALIGPNGAGKTTFLKTILGQTPPLAGELALGASLQVGYFAQAHEGLDPDKTLLQEIDAIMPNWLPGQIRDYLGKFVFSGDDVYKKVEMLSGGERGRLALAKLALQDTNLLLLDEPTNHLDIPSQEILQAVLDDYSGTILLVTHDRYLIDALGTQIWEIDPDESSLDVFEGTYSQRKEERERLAALRSTGMADGARGLETGEGAQRSRRRESNQSVKVERRRRARIQELENKIASLEAELADIGARLENPPDDPARVAQLGKDYARVQAEMDALLGEWEELHS